MGFIYGVQILQAHARKVPLSTSVDLTYYAEATEGFSGADLQALIYNAHLEVVHASINRLSTETPVKETLDSTSINYTVLSGPVKTGITSRAEETALQRRVRLLAMLRYSGLKTRCGI